MKKLLLILLLPSVMFGATLTRYVNTASTPGGNGTTNDTAGDNRAYHSQNEFEAAENQDLASAGNTMICYLYGVTPDSQTVTYSGWGTSATSRLVMQGDNYTGKASTCHYRMAGMVIPANGAAITISNSYITLNNIEISDVGDYGDWSSCMGISVGGYAGVTIANCLLHDINALYAKVIGISIGSDQAGNYNTNVTKCILYNLTSWYPPHGISFPYNNGQGAYNCTVSSVVATGTNQTNGHAYYAFNYSGAYLPTIINCIAQQTESQNYYGTWSTMTAYNISQDTTAASIGWSEKTITFVNAAAGDFHLASTDTDAIDKGADLSSIFTTDIDGVTRSGTWDIGADEYVSAEPPAPAPSVPFLPQVMIWEN